MNGPLLETKNLSAHYDKRQVLDDITLACEPGTVTAILGPNGAGKSTLLRCLSGFIKPSAGQVLLDGKDLARWPGQERARAMASVAQEEHLEFEFTARELVLMGRTPWLSRFGSETRADIEAVRHAMELTGTLEFADRLVSALSGGERKRVFMARALAQGARVLLLDEPVTHLDLRHQASLLTLIRTLTREHNLASVVVLHGIDHALEAADRVAVLAGGKLKAAGEPRAMLTQELIERVYEVRVVPTTAADGSSWFHVPLSD